MRVYILLLFFINTVSGCTTDDDCSGDVCDVTTSTCTTVSSLPEWSCTGVGGSGNQPERAGSYKVSYDCTLTVSMVYAGVGGPLHLYGIGKPTITAMGVDSRHFDIGLERTLKLKNLKLTGGTGGPCCTNQGNGGSILQQDKAKFYAISVDFFGNEALYDGGAIRSYGGTPGITYLENVNITGNTAGGAGGGIFRHGGNLRADSIPVGDPQDLVIKDSIIEGNTGGNGGGGGIYLRHSILDMTNTVIRGNTASVNHVQYGGGGLYLYGRIRPANIRECEFDQNTAAGNRGHDVFILRESEFQGGTATIVLVNTQFTTTTNSFYSYRYYSPQGADTTPFWYSKSCADETYCVVAPYTGTCSDNADGVSMTCPQAICMENQHASNGACVACPAGKSNVAGDTSGTDTTCDDIICGVNEHVKDNACVACPAGSTRAAGDDASGATTYCTLDTPCGQNQFVNTSHQCEVCASGTYNDVGDTVVGSCDDTEKCITGYHVKTTYNSDNTKMYGLTACSDTLDCQTKCTADSACAGISEKVGKIAMGAYHTCALFTNSSVYCLGRNSEGQLGDGTAGSDVYTWIYTGIDNAIDIDCHDRTSAAVLADNTVRFWGKETRHWGSSSTTGSSTPVISRQTINDAVKISMGSGTTCVLTTSNGLTCMGSYSGAGANYQPTSIFSSGIIDLSFGNNHGCVVKEDNTAWCWGDNSGRLGDGTTTSQTTPTLVSGGISFSRIYASDSHTCGIATNSKVYCWGLKSDYKVEPGVSDSTQQLTPLDLSLNAKDMALGNKATCFIKLNDELHCWGANYGFSTTPALVTTSILQVAMAPFSSTSMVAIGSNGNLYSQGYNYHGQLAIGANGNHQTVVETASDNFVYKAYGPLVSGTAISFTKDKGCQLCPAGYTNDAMDDPAGAETTCDFIPCQINERITNGQCTPCTPGATRAAGDSDSLTDTYCTCGVNQHVVGNVCTECPAGATRAAGDDASGSDTICLIPPCARDYNVKDNVCVPCPTGMTNDAGDTNANGDTYCDSTFVCGEDQYVSNNQCVDCPAAKTAPYGSNPAGADTVCDWRVCKRDEYSDGTSCQTCTAGYNNPGDTTETVTTCDDAQICKENHQLSFKYTLQENYQISNSGGYLAENAITDFDYAKKLCDLDSSCNGLTKDSSNNYYLSDGTASSNSAYDAYNINRAAFDCLACRGSGTHAAGEDPNTATGITNCAYVDCPANYGSSGGSCVACTDGKVRNPPINPEQDHKCTSVPCAADEYVKTLYAYQASTDKYSGTSCTDVSDCETKCSADSACSGYTIGKQTILATGNHHACAIQNDGSIACWGRGQYNGQQGDGVNADNTVPGPVSVITGATDALTAVQISAGSDHTCSVMKDGTLYCWGRNWKGGLGIGSLTDHNTPQVVLQNVKSVACGDFHTCALMNSGSVKCWGYNNYGQLGDGTTTDSQSPIDVSGLTDVVQIFSGSSAKHTCVIKSSGNVWCWGWNKYGQLGDGSPLDAGVPPVQVSGIANAEQVSTGAQHACILLAGGTVKCMGAGSMGRLADGNTGFHNEATPINTQFSNVIEIKCGGYSTCALLGDGTVKCAGRNNYGQLGDGTTTDNGVPQAAIGISSALQLSSGTYFSCVAMSGSFSCWGQNDYYMLGDGTQTSQSTPISPVTMAIAAPFSIEYGPLVAGSGDSKYKEKSGTACTACPAGSTNEAGDTDLNGETQCDWGTCGLNEYASNKQCVTCAPGTFNDAGDDAGVDSTCDDPDTCDQNEYSDGTQCLACPGSGTNEAGDRANVVTTCNFPTCGTNERVVSNACVACDTGTFNDAGDDAGGADTTCDDSEVCPANHYALANYVSSTNKYGTTSCSSTSDCETKCTSDGTCKGYTSMGFGAVKAWGNPSYGGGTIPSGLTSGIAKVVGADTAFAVLKTDGTVTAWGGYSGGDVPSGLTGVVDIVSSQHSFAALKSDGGVKAWGYSTTGGTDPGITSGVTKIFSTNSAFAALKTDGSVQVWGDSSNGGTDPGITSGVVDIFSTTSAFAALKSDGSIITWGAEALNVPISDPGITGGVIKVVGSYTAFAALKSDGSVVTWGASTHGGTDPGIGAGSGITEIFSTMSAFAALKSDGSVQVWGDSSAGGTDPGITSDVVKIFSTNFAFAALKSDGSVKAWGNPTFGGSDPGLTSGVTKIFSKPMEGRAFVALKDDGSIKAWGQAGYGGTDPGITSGVVDVVGNSYAFAAVKSDGSVQVWGHSDRGGTDPGITSGVTTIFATDYDFLAAIESLEYGPLVAGSGSSHEKSGTCTACTNGGTNTGGKVDSGLVCVYPNCQTDQYSTGDGQCLTCPVGRFMPTPINPSTAAECSCLADERVQTNACVACPSGFTNAAGDDPNGADTECDFTPCALNHYVAGTGDSRVCTACTGGTFSAGGLVTECSGTEYCAVNQKVVSNACVNCPAGFQNALGVATDKSGPDGTCAAAPCTANQYSDGSICHDCPQHTGADSAGLDPTAGVTQCVPTTCGKDQHVENNACKLCDSTSYRLAGDQVFGGDTHCFCKDDHKVINKACVACEAGSSNPNLCYSGLQDHYCVCHENYHVVSNLCTACPAGATRPAGDYAGNADTHCICGEDQHVVSNACVACPAGTKRPAGDDSSGPDTPCSCQENEHVKNVTNVLQCTTCPTGSLRAAGDLVANGETVCACPENFHVSNGQCVACVAGTRAAGDDPLAGDTHCTCNENHHVASNVCTACPSDSTRAAGDDAGGDDTKCACNENFRVSGGSCAACSANTEVAAGGDLGGDDTVCTCKENFYSNGDGSCSACGSGAIIPAGSDPAVASVCTCDAGYELNGASCSACGANEESVAGGACLCKENHHVSSGACTLCAPGSTHPAGDDKSVDTVCNNTLCAENERVEGNVCVPCIPGMIRAAGDDATGADTACAYTGTTHTVSTAGSFAFRIDALGNNAEMTIRVGETHTFYRVSSGDPFRIVTKEDCDGNGCDQAQYSLLPTSSLDLNDAVKDVSVTVFTPTVAGKYYYLSTENGYRKGIITVKWPLCTITYPTTTLTESCEMDSEQVLTGDLTITYELARLRALGAHVSLGAQEGDVPQIMASEGGRHFTVSGGHKLSIENIDLNGGRGSEGGSILVDNGEIEANNVKFTDNVASSAGGAIRVKNSASKINMANIMFEDNQGSEGGAISIQDTLLQKVEIHGSDFKNNRAASGDGGAIKADSELNITGSNFENNAANTGEGGGISATKDVTMSGSSFKNNKALKGGAMKSSGNKVVLSNMVVEANEAVEDGGAFNAENAEFDVRTTTFLANKAKRGAAFKTRSTGCTTDCKPIKIQSSSMEGNEATVAGGAVDFDGDASAEPQFWVQDTELKNNKANGQANDFKQRGASVKIKAIDSEVGTIEGGAVDATCEPGQCVSRPHSTCEVTATGTKCACDGTNRHLSGKECKAHKVCTGLGLDVEIRAPDKDHDRLCGTQSIADLTYKLDAKGQELANLIEAKLVSEGVAADEAYALAVEVFGEINKCE